jgi:DNA-binding transcriptional MerR regulator
VGVSPELLRAWETRYGLVDPERTSGGLRLYSDEDERRVQAMKDHLANGLAASEAARLARVGQAPAGSMDLSQIARSIEEAFDELDEPAAQQALDRLFGSFALESALDGVILPFLRRVGERWARAELSVAGEHFTSNVIGGRLRAMARGWGQGFGPRAILACPPGEQHELGLVCFGLLLRERGWRITYLGAGTPTGDIEAALGALEPSVVVLAAVTPQRFEDAQREIAELARRTRVAIGGAGASEAAAESLGAELLPGNLAAGAATLAP